MSRPFLNNVLLSQDHTRGKAIKYYAMKSNATFYTVLVLFLFWGTLFWLQITICSEGNSLPSAITLKWIVLTGAWVTTTLCIYTSAHALYSTKQAPSFVHYAALLLSGVMFLTLVATSVLFKFLYWK